MLRAYFTDDITVLYSEGHDTRGEPSTTTDVPMKAYVVWKTHLVRDIAGEQVVSRGMVYAMPERVITHADVIKIKTIKYVVLDVRPGKAFSPNHQEIHLQ